MMLGSSHGDNCDAFTAIKDDVMIEILIRLPLKSLLKSKCVCQWWCSLISDPLFMSNYTRINPQLNVSGFYLQKSLFLHLYSDLKFISFDGQRDVAPSPSLAYIKDEKGVSIQHSCNGLLLCSSFRCHEEERLYYVCKPTTKQYFPLPRPPCRTVFGIGIAFDANISAEVRIICVCDSQLSAHHHQIQTYSSVTGKWKASGNPFTAGDDVLFRRGVFWNNALHWVGRGESSLRFDIEKECLHKMPMPAIPEGWEERRLAYFGESGGQLYLIENYGPNTAIFDVLEMRRDYSAWYIKYHVNLNAVAVENPVMVRQNVQQIHHFVFSIMHIVHKVSIEEQEVEDPTMVIHIPGKFISYNLKNGSFFRLQSQAQDPRLGLEYCWWSVYPYHNTLCYI